ncbi:MAG: hypothetical protein GXZ03_02905 [Proteiniphilum sp.]|nr:hypothetical protein [Proteiniphilum sp.]
MKDITITSKRLKKESTIFIVCFIIAFIINVVSIFIYKTSWFELFTQIGYVTIISIVLYLLFVPIRGVISLVRKML